MLNKSPVHYFFNYYSPMNKFKKRTFAETLELLLLADDEIPKKKGKAINVRGAAAKLKIPQPTVKRWLDGYSADPDADNVEKLCKFFKVTRDQLFGRAPITWIDKDAVVDDFADQKDSVLPEIQKIVAELPSQPKAMQQMFVRLYEATRREYEQFKLMQLEGEVQRKFEKPQPKKPKKTGDKHE